MRNETLNEYETRQQIIDQKLNLAGWNVSDPSQVIQELDIVLKKGSQSEVAEPDSSPYACPLPTSHVTEALHMGQTKARCAANGCSIGKHRNAGQARVQGFPSGLSACVHAQAGLSACVHAQAGEPPSGHLLRCALLHLQWNNHYGEERALHMTTGRLAVARLVGKGQA